MVVEDSEVFMQSERNPNVAKWNILFDKKGTEWISFKPKLGLYVYPCYACRNMFGSKNSFLDHVNRRGILLKYKCSHCALQEEFTFYNPCSFLLHARQHFSLLGGHIDLQNLEISLLPYGLAGFLPNPDVSLLYDVQDDDIPTVNCRFYSPINDCMGKSMINLLPNELLFYYADEITKELTSLILKQVSSNIPRCMFVLQENRVFPLQTNGGLMTINGRTLQPGESCIVTVKEEPIEYPLVIYDVPVISKVETVQQNFLSFTKCLECDQAQNETMSQHFLKSNRPSLLALNCQVCKYIAPTKCSLKAHERIHDSIPPFVCPECGKDFPSWQNLHEHMNDVCFHLTKQVRIRCTARRCGKIFAQITTFSAHFLSHVQVGLKCDVCEEILRDDLEFLHHSSMHEIKGIATKVFKCLACTDDLEKYYTNETLQDHIKEHAADKYLYIYICRNCHSYFRSPANYATHLLKCGKSSDLQSIKKLTCPTCKTPSGKSSYCANCNQAQNHTEPDGLSEPEQAYCPLCDKELILNNITEHLQNVCQYSKAIVMLNDCARAKQKVSSPKRKKAFIDVSQDKKR